MHCNLLNLHQQVSIALGIQQIHIILSVVQIGHRFGDKELAESTKPHWRFQLKVRYLKCAEMIKMIKESNLFY